MQKPRSKSEQSVHTLIARGPSNTFYIFSMELKFSFQILVTRPTQNFLDKTCSKVMFQIDMYVDIEYYLKLTPSSTLIDKA